MRPSALARPVEGVSFFSSFTSALRAFASAFRSTALQTGSMGVLEPSADCSELQEPMGADYRLSSALLQVEPT